MLRIDRLLTLYFFYPLMRILPQRKELRIPILMYHSISESNERRIHPYYETCTSPGVFAEHMKFLYENKYKVINLDQAVKIFKFSDTNFSDSLTNKPLAREIFTSLNSKTIQLGHGNDSLSRLIHDSEERRAFNWGEANLTGINQLTNQRVNYAVLTFDDGFRDFYTHAFPILQQYGFSATVFLPTAYIGDERKRFKKKYCLTWVEVKELHERGIIFGSHTVTHAKLAELSKDEVEYEMKESKEEIENHTGYSVKAFCYPYAFPDQDKRFVRVLLSLIEKCGYEIGVTTRVGLASNADNIFTLKRIPTNDFDDQIFFASKLGGSYDWLQKFQVVYKKVKRVRKQG